MNKDVAELLEKKKSYRNLLLNIRNLPSIPFIMYEVSKLLSSPNTSATDLGKIIRQDQGMVAKILTVANSPLYGLPRRVATIEFAIVILGFEHIKNIVVALSMIEAFKKADGKDWNSNAYWKHSIMTASAAKRIADELGYPKSGEVFTAGLLHDLGISVMRRYLHHEFDKITDLVKNQQMRYLSAEEAVLGITHQEVGQILANRWNLPEALGDTIAHHHRPSDSQDNKIVTSIIHLADYMTQRLGHGGFDWDDSMELDEGVIQILNLGNEVNLNKFIESHEVLFREQEEALIL